MPADHHYKIYGLRLDSTRPIPGALVDQGHTPAEVVVDLEGIPSRFAIPPALEAAPAYTSRRTDERDEPSLKLWKLEAGKFIRFRYRDNTQFVVDQPGSRIWAEWPPSMTLEDTYTYLLGPVLGYVLRLRGVLCLHASLVAVDGNALALLGPVGAGKSTTAAALALRGCSVLSEDVAPLIPSGAGFSAQPGYARIRLWPQSSEILFGAKDFLPQLAPPWEKCYLDLLGERYHFETRPLPLRAIYLLQPRTRYEAAPLLEEMLPRQGLMELVANTYMNQHLGPEQRGAEFELLGRLLDSVTIRRITAHVDASRLDQLCQMILCDFRKCMNGSVQR